MRSTEGAVIEHVQDLWMQIGVKFSCQIASAGEGTFEILEAKSPWMAVAGVGEIEIPQVVGRDAERTVIEENSLDESFVRKHHLPEVIDNVGVLVDEIEKNVRALPADDVPVAAGEQAKVR